MGEESDHSSSWFVCSRGACSVPALSASNDRLLRQMHIIRFSQFSIFTYTHYDDYTCKLLARALNQQLYSLCIRVFYVNISCGNFLFSFNPWHSCMHTMRSAFFALTFAGASVVWAWGEQSSATRYAVAVVVVAVVSNRKQRAWHVLYYVSSNNSNRLNVQLTINRRLV